MRQGPKCKPTPLSNEPVRQHPKSSMTRRVMSTEADLHIQNVANAAAVLAEAVESAPDRELTTQETPVGDVGVILDGDVADVVLPGGVTVHIRGDD